MPQVDEYEDKPSLYKALRGLIMGEEFVNPYRHGETSFDQNPKKFIDRTDPSYQESIYAEPSELPTMDTGGVAAITKRDAVKMLAKTAKERFGPLLKRQPPEKLVGSGWEGGEFLSVGNEGMRAAVGDVIKEARRTPDYLLDPLKKTEFTTIPEENVAGYYFSRETIKGTNKSTTPRIEIDPALGNAKTFRHEIGHSRHLDPVMTERAIEASEGVTSKTPEDVLRTYMELVTSQVGTQGKADAAKAGKNFYWNNPRELIARRYATLTGGDAPLDIAETEKMYKEALQTTFKETVAKAPKYSRKVIKDSGVESYMSTRFGNDWKDFVRLGAKSETKDVPLYKITSDHFAKVGMDRPNFGKIIDTYADMSDRLKSIVRKAISIEE